MNFTRLISAVLVSVGVALGAPPAEDASKQSPPPSISPQAQEPTADPGAPPPTLRILPPVLRNSDKEDSLLVVLPGAAAAPAEDPAPLPASTANPAAPPAGDAERPLLHRAPPAYPTDFGVESAIFCQKQIGDWTLDDAVDLLGEPRGHRVSLDDDGVENGDIFAFSDASSRYRELELDFDRETGALRSVFAYPWKMTWQECRKIWGTRVSATNADKGRTFYSYLDRRLDVLVDPAGKVINFGLY
jgi:hypothetical protein